MSRNRNSPLGAVILAIAASFAGHSTYAQTRGLVQSDSVKYSYLKFSALPFFYKIFQEIPSIWLIFHYESQFKPRGKFTYDVVLDFQSQRTDGLTLNGAIDFRFRPQIRYYTGANAFKGFYAGAFPLYAYMGGQNATSIGVYLGGGLTTGYQYILKNKLALEVNFSYNLGKAAIEKQEYGDVYKVGIIELNVGLPVRKKR